jgi:hypothetical protein
VQWGSAERWSTVAWGSGSATLPQSSQRLLDGFCWAALVVVCVVVLVVLVVLADWADCLAWGQVAGVESGVSWNSSPLPV